MTDQESAEAEAKNLLPCKPACRPGSGHHWYGCPRHYRPTVAEALLELKVENADLIAGLRVELAAAQELVDIYKAKLEAAKPEPNLKFKEYTPIKCPAAKIE